MLHGARYTHQHPDPCPPRHDLVRMVQEEGGSPSASRSLYSEPFLTLHERRIHQLIHEAEQISKAISEGFDEVRLAAAPVLGLRLHGQQSPGLQ